MPIYQILKKLPELKGYYNKLATPTQPVCTQENEGEQNLSPAREAATFWLLNAKTSIYVCAK